MLLSHPDIITRDDELLRDLTLNFTRDTGTLVLVDALPESY